MSRRRRRRVYSGTHRKYRTGRSTGKKKSAVLTVVVICLSVGAGYMTATYLLGPAMGLETQPSFFEKLKTQENDKTEKNDDIKSVENDTEKNSEIEKGFALQYGSFSTKAGAEECVQQLKKSGLNAEVIEKDGSYKVIGPIFDTKEEARQEKEKSAVSDEIFVTEIP